MRELRPLRSVLRPIAGRERTIWRALHAPRLRFALFRDPVDCVLYGLALSLPRVRFIQIGSNAGGAGDPLWTFRAYSNWTGILVEPVDYLFARLRQAYAPWAGRFVFENAAIAAGTGLRPFHHIAETSGLRPGYDQLGSFDEALLRAHAAHFGAEDRIVTSMVRCLGFGELCDRHDVQALDLLHVDAEGSDAEILAQVDLARLHPAVVLFEHVHMSDPVRAATRARFQAEGYRLREVGIDTLAARADALERLPAFAAAWRIVSDPP